MINLMEKVGGLFGHYAGASPQQPPENVHADYDNIASNVPPETLAHGLSHAFRSNETPPFGQMVSQLYSHGNTQQRTGLLSTLLGSVGPTGLSSLAARGPGLSSLLSAFRGGGQNQITPAQADQLSPQEVEALASHAEKQNPSIIDQVSGFYSQHPTLVKTLGAGALTLMMAKMAAKHRAG
ncbi:MAG: hypothetical protein JWR69_1674 [Pedosphaera sp.]|nr:hypothetical protein [Pedosphaera sp.]